MSAQEEGIASYKHGGPCLRLCNNCGYYKNLNTFCFIVVIDSPEYRTFIDAYKEFLERNRPFVIRANKYAICFPCMQHLQAKKAAKMNKFIGKKDC
jgi:hypothetical protein